MTRSYCKLYKVFDADKNLIELFGTQAEAEQFVTDKINNSYVNAHFNIKEYKVPVFSEVLTGRSGY